MKNSILCLASLFLFIFPSCEKDDDGSTIGGVERGTIIANINGDNFKNTTATSTISPILSSELFRIAAAGNANSILIDFSIPMGEFLEASNYSFDYTCEVGIDGICGVLTYTDIVSLSPIQTDSYSSKIEAGDFDIEITALDYRSGGFIAGTFSGTVVSIDDNSKSFTVTDGKFNVDIN